MNKINDSQLMLIVGGFNWTGVIINALTGTGKFIFSVGQSLGSSLRRIGNKNLCKY
ncbi:MAG: hypothetical protein MRZ42_03025 [Tenericutes bacterium]|nr:hypothetical protein [Mycoplasmatota bacterium]